MNPKDILRGLGELVSAFFKAKASGYVEFDLVESRNLMTMLVFSPLAGFPLIPASITLELLPLMEDELGTALARMSTLDDPWGILGGRMDIE